VTGSLNLAAHPCAAICSGVLSDAAIQAYVDKGLLIVEGFLESSLRPASYDVTIANDGLIGPDDQEVPPRRSRLCPRSVRSLSSSVRRFAFEISEWWRAPLVC
jgi:hypothetical protein